MSIRLMVYCDADGCDTATRCIDEEGKPTGEVAIPAFYSNYEKTQWFGAADGGFALPEGWSSDRKGEYCPEHRRASD